MTSSANPDLLPETPVMCNDHTYTARRNAEPEPDGSWRWQVFRDNEMTPVGFIQSHDCPEFGEFGKGRLMVFDANGRPMSEPKPDRGDGCVGSYQNALAWFEMELLLAKGRRSATT